MQGSLLKQINIMSLLLCSLLASANLDASDLPLNIEEKRLTKILEVSETSVDEQLIVSLISEVKKLKVYEEAKLALLNAGNQLWQKTKKDVKSKTRFDDRPLYWQRLATKAAVKQAELQFSTTEVSALLEVFEQASRGYFNNDYIQNAQKQIFITGFDPFLLDKNIQQSNPSGLAALSLDGKVIEYQGVKAELKAVIVPVRYEDFDRGEIESLLAPIYLGGIVDMVTTISMGREHFDLERFPGKRRSVTTPDNLNVLTGANKSNPIIALLAGEKLTGEEFVEFSLPVTAMQKATGQYKVIDNHKVESLEKGEMTPKSIKELAGLTAVTGGGGGYLSNEISYRSIRLSKQLDRNIPTGHIHTPRIKGFDQTANEAIVSQIEEMLRYAIAEI